MRILVVGATGTVGKAVAAELAQRHEVIPASRTEAAHRVDITEEASIRALFEAVGPLDAVVSATGEAHFGPLASMTMDQFEIGVRSKLMGQIRLAMIAQTVLAERGSITLTSGVLSHDPIAQGANATTVNAGIEGFVRAAAIELPRGIRINAVSATVLVESLPVYAPFFRGFEAAPASRVALAYSKSVEGAQTGQVYRVL